MKERRSLCCYILLLLVLTSAVEAIAAAGTGSGDGSEKWGYVQVRPRAHMFWWLYRSPNRVEDPSNPWPTVLWLQGGPGGSGVGIGNFQEIGPLDTNLRPRNSTWLQKADLLFVDNPVGTGYSFVEGKDPELFVKTDEEAGEDLTRLLIALFNKDEGLQQSPLYIVAESYGGKFAVTTALSVLDAVQAGKLKLILGGVALGDSWISPEDFVISWAPLLKDVSRMDNTGLEKSNGVAMRISEQLKEGKFEEATSSWAELENLIASFSNSVDFYNFLLDAGVDPVSLAAVELSTTGGLSMRKYSRYLSSTKTSTPGGDGGDLDELMNGAVKKKLKIIPRNFTWGEQSDMVFAKMGGDFMKPRINEVDELLERGVNVTIYSGQVDLICATKGTESWVEKLKWGGKGTFLGMGRTPLYCGGEEEGTKAFTRSYKNLHFYWILGAGHFVPVDQPCVALDMVGAITRSPTTSKLKVR